MRRVARSAAYRPSWNRDGAPALGPDEDALTLVATVAERALPSDGGPPVCVRLLGAAADVSDDDLAAVVGGRAPTFRAEGDSADLGAAMAAAASGVEGSELVVAADLGESASGNARPAGAVALWFVPSEAGEALPATSRGGAATTAAVRWLSAGTTAREVEWVGPWGEPEDSGTPAGDWDPSDPAPATVSEGAYVPRARYLESRPSRWRFDADRCGACGTWTFPARGRCRACGRSDAIRASRLPLDGGICVAVTVIGKGGQPTEFDAQVEATGPYAVALVDLAPGVRATLSVADPPADALRIGDRVATRLRRLYAIDGAWRYGRKAVPFRTPSAVSFPASGPAPTEPPPTPRRSGGRGRSGRRAD